MVTLTRAVAVWALVGLCLVVTCLAQKKTAASGKANQRFLFGLGGLGHNNHYPPHGGGYGYNRPPSYGGYPGYGGGYPGYGGYGGGYPGYGGGYPAHGGYGGGYPGYGSYGGGHKHIIGPVIGATAGALIGSLAGGYISDQIHQG